MFTQGTANADVLNGGAADDTLYGAGGNDRLTGNGGHDVLTGDAGHDTLSGGAGEDYLMGGAGNDSLDGGADADWAGYEDATAAVKVDLNLTTAQNTLGGGTDTLKNIENLYGSAFNDTLIGNSAVNYLHGGAGADSLFGANGDDHLDGGAGNDTLNGGNGDDVVSYENGIVGGVTLDLNLTTGQANGAHGTDTLISIEAIWGSGYDDKLTGNTADNYLYGGAGQDTLSGGAGADVLDGAAGNDVITGGQGADDLTGGAGDDLFKFAAGDSGVFNALGGVAAGTTDVVNGFAGGTRGTGTANGTGDTLDFGIVQGTATNYAENTAATSAAAATQANSAFLANSALRYVATQVGSDTLVFASDADGGQAHNLVTLKGVGTGVIGFNNIVGTAVVTPPVNPNLIVGTEGAEVLSGTAGDDTIQGLGGADTIVSGAGVDVLSGGVGDDLFQIPGSLVATAPDRIIDFEGGTRGTGTIGGTGDRLYFATVTGTADNYVETSAASYAAALSEANLAFAADQHLRYVATQVDGDVYVFANTAPSITVVSSIMLVDVTTASVGFNNLVGSPAPIIDPNLISGKAGADNLSGTTASDIINGAAGDDTLSGGDKSDTLFGGAGADMISGGAADDLFAFSPNDTGLLSPTTDTILDFQGGTRGLGSGTGGDRLDFGLEFGFANNYLENSAASVAEARSLADAAFANPVGYPLRYVATQVGDDVHLFVRISGDHEWGSVVGSVTLKGVGTDSISYNNIVSGEGVGSTGELILGTGGIDTLVGTAGRDVIFGGAGQDTFIAGLGNDVVTGGSGEDRFVFAPGDSGVFTFFDTVTPGTADTIKDFETGSDVIKFGVAGNNTAGTGNYVELAAVYTVYADAEIAAGAAFQSQPSLVYVVTQVGPNTYLFADTGGSNGPDSVVFLQGVTLSGIFATDIV